MMGKAAKKGELTSKPISRKQVRAATVSGYTKTLGSRRAIRLSPGQVKHITQRRRAES